MKTFKVLGLLMSYPKPEWVSHVEECKTLLMKEQLLPKKHLKAVLAFIDDLATADLYGVQETYVDTFDRGRSQSLHLFEHIHGESRDRGQAMVDLATAYEQKGLFIDRAELPDYLPLFLEYLSMCPVDEALEFLGEPIDIVAIIAARLRKRNSTHAALFDALVALSRVKPSQSRIKEMIAQESEDQSLEALDKEWEEAAVFGGPPVQDPCVSCEAPGAGLDIKISP